MDNQQKPQHPPEDQKKQEEGNAKETAKKVLFIAVALIVLFLIAFGVVRIVPTLISSLGSAGTSLSGIFKPKDHIELSLNQSAINSGDEFTINWSHIATTTGQNGRYTFIYTCKDNFYLQHTYPNGQTEKVICNDPFVLPNQASSLNFKAFLTSKNAFVDVPMSVNYVEENHTISASSTLTVRSGTTANIATSTHTASTTISGYFVNHDTGTTTSTTKSSSSYESSYTHTTANYPRTKADLVATSITTGHIDRSTNTFIPGSVNPGDRAAVQFEVENIGGSYTGTWHLSAAMPTFPVDTYTSPDQPSLAPGDRILFTLGFDNPAHAGDNIIEVSLDSSNNVAESNKRNNTFVAHVYLNGNPTYIYNYNGNGQVDFTTRIIATGVMDYNNSFVASNLIPYGSNAAVRFEISNLGGNISPSWTFRANLPNSQVYDSPLQAPLAPGETRQFTLAFGSQYYSSYNTINIVVDQYNNVAESNEGNNTASISVRTQ